MARSAYSDDEEDQVHYDAFDYVKVLLQELEIER